MSELELESADGSSDEGPQVASWKSGAPAFLVNRVGDGVTVDRARTGR